MRRGSKWGLLKSLLNDKTSRGAAMLATDRIINKKIGTGSSKNELVKELANIYLPIRSKNVTAGNKDNGYKGEDRPELDEPFTISEVRRALFNLNGRSAPGPDGITNKLLRNLDDKAIDTITVEINKIWKEGQVPREWRTAKVVLIPKPGKAPEMRNLRPISLTSCLGKVAEHVIHNRVTEYIERNDLFRHNLIGYRQGLSTQDALLLIQKAAARYLASAEGHFGRFADIASTVPRGVCSRSGCGARKRFPSEHSRDGNVLTFSVVDRRRAVSHAIGPGGFERPLAGNVR
ncbi:hypothetical protein HPB50_006209 [Hyalomma asiaticum]|uniref:Uncharacterized protein n=1 Tax=Hyalomma asiaticum TaxID=266040 RepID=A0ACB7SKU3_HYAAI|nr:hypothetical protein HPB50_006209 [Hyalomma asiaticum]